MARVYKPAGPSSNKAAAPVEESKKQPGKNPDKKQKEADGQ